RARDRAAQLLRDPKAPAREASKLAVAADGQLHDQLAQVGADLAVKIPTAEAKATLLELRGLWGGLRALGLAIRAQGRRAVIGAIAFAAIAILAVVYRDQLVDWKNGALAALARLATVAGGLV